MSKKAQLPVPALPDAFKKLALHPKQQWYFWALWGISEDDRIISGMTEKELAWFADLLRKVEDGGRLEGDLSGLIEMLELAKKHIKSPSIRFLVPTLEVVQQHPDRIGSWTQFGRSPEKVNLRWFEKVRLSKTNTEGKDHFNLYFFGNADLSEWSYSSRRYAGSVYPDGRFFLKDWAEPLKEPLIAVLNEFSKAPDQTARAFGSLMSICSFCGSRLDDPTSVNLGYGPVCAKHYGLPWGKPTQ